MGRRERHLWELADQLDVSLILLEGSQYPGDTCPSGLATSINGAYRKATVWCWNARSQSAYFVGLHELGHHAVGHHDSIVLFEWRYTVRMVDAEAEAWQWAFDNALEEPLPSTLHRAADSFDNYLRYFGAGREAVSASLCARLDVTA